jgi:hypothetical protein
MRNLAARRRGIELRIVAPFGKRVGGTRCQHQIARKLQAVRSANSRLFAR